MHHWGLRAVSLRKPHSDHNDSCRRWLARVETAAATAPWVAETVASEAEVAHEAETEGTEDGSEAQAGTVAAAAAAKVVASTEALPDPVRSAACSAGG